MTRAALADISVANAPCSWGVLGGFEPAEQPITHDRVLDEMAAAGYAGTELGDWGFMPTGVAELRAALARRGLAMAGAFVPVALADRAAHDAGVAQALRVARLLGEVASAEDGCAPVVVLADAGTAPTRIRMAGRIGPEHGLSEPEWRTLIEGASRIARAVREATGLRTAFHHHCATLVETPEEVEMFLQRADPKLIGLCFDTGHYTYGGGGALDGLRRFSDRVWHVHFKDCDGAVLAQARAAGWDYYQAVRHRIFCELGTGQVDFPALLEELAAWEYRGWIVVEEDVAPGTGAPFESARRDRAFLRELGL